MKVKKLFDVVKVTLIHPSFSWANGFYILLAHETDYDGYVRLCRLDPDGNPETFDGKFLEGMTSIKAVTATNLKLEWEVEECDHHG